MQLGEELQELQELEGQETGLPQARPVAERRRTVAQLRLFAQVVRSGDWLALRIDPAQREPRDDRSIVRQILLCSNYALAIASHEVRRLIETSSRFQCCPT